MAVVGETAAGEGKTSPFWTCPFGEVTFSTIFDVLGIAVSSKELCSSRHNLGPSSVLSQVLLSVCDEGEGPSSAGAETGPWVFWQVASWLSAVDVELAVPCSVFVLSWSVSDRVSEFFVAFCMPFSIVVTLSPGKEKEDLVNRRKMVCWTEKT